MRCDWTPAIHEGAHLADEEPQRALQLLDEGLRLAPESPKAYQHKGRAFLRLGQFDAARGAFQRALAISPDDDRFALALRRLDMRANSQALPLERLPMAAE